MRNSIITTIERRRGTCTDLGFTRLILLLLLPTIVARSRDGVTTDSVASEELVRLAKNNLLRAFGLSSLPDTNRKTESHDYMVQLYLRLEEYRRMGGHGVINTVRGLRCSGLPGQGHAPSNAHLSFNVSGLPADEQMVFSELRLRSSRARLGTKAMARLFRVFLFGRNQETLGRPTWSQVDAVTLDVFAHDTQWLAFNVVDFIRQTKATNADGVEFIVRVLDVETQQFVSPDAAGLDVCDSEMRTRPLLVLFLDDGLGRASAAKVSERRKRAPKGRKADKTKKGDGKPKRRKKNICRRKAMFVNFDDFGWTNWIIAPSGYEAYFCEGSCAYPIAAHLSPTNHATIQSIVNSMDPSLIKPSCCTPDALSSISILYVDNNDRVVYKKKEDMVVESCGCK